MAKDICSLLKEDDIEARTFWKPVHLQKPYGNCPKSDISVSEDLWQRIVTLPCSTNITEEELFKVVISIKEIVGKLL